LNLELLQLDKYLERSRLCRKVLSFSLRRRKSLGEVAISDSGTIVNGGSPAAVGPEDYISSRVSALQRTREFVMTLTAAATDARIVLGRNEGDVYYLFLLFSKFAVDWCRWGAAGQVSSSESLAALRRSGSRGSLVLSSPETGTHGFVLKTRSGSLCGARGRDNATRE
jgi:hypothetical protein